MVNVWPASVLRRSVLEISTILACVANSKKKELIKRSGRKDLYVLIELDIFLATVGPKIDKKLQKWSAVQLESEISWLLMVNVEGNLLERLFIFIIWFKIFQVPFALFFNNSSFFHNRETLLDVESDAVCSYILGIFLIRWSRKIYKFFTQFVLLLNVAP